MAENVYEGMFLLDSNRYSRDPSGVAGQIPEMIQQHGGEVLASRLWDERRLAYPVDGHRKGTYWLTYFRMDGRQLTTVNRQCQLNDNILRTLFVKVDPRIVDTLVAHANSSTGPSVPIERKPPKETEEVAEGVPVPELDDR